MAWLRVDAWRTQAEQRDQSLDDGADLIRPCSVRSISVGHEVTDGIVIRPQTQLTWKEPDETPSGRTTVRYITITSVRTAINIHLRASVTAQT